MFRLDWFVFAVFACFFHGFLLCLGVGLFGCVRIGLVWFDCFVATFLLFCLLFALFRLDLVV